MCLMQGRNGMRMSDDIEWLLRMAEKEDGCIVSVGGLVAAIEDREVSRSVTQLCPNNHEQPEQA